MSITKEEFIDTLLIASGGRTSVEAQLLMDAFEEAYEDNSHATLDEWSVSNTDSMRESDYDY